MSVKEKDKLLVIMDSYYPDSRATTHIMQRILEGLSKEYEITVFVLNLLKRVDTINAIGEFNGVTIKYIEPLDYSSLFKRSVNKVKKFLVDSKYKRKYKVTYKYFELKNYSLQIRRFIIRSNIKKLISVSSPNDIHICANMVVEGRPDIKWFPVCFDPHAYNVSYSEDFRIKLVFEETVLYDRAQRIFMLTQSENDYKDSVFHEKIVFFDIPLNNVLYKIKNKNNNSIVLTYVGNFYREIRNPDRMLKILAQLKNDAVIYLIGDFSGWGNELSDYLGKWNSIFGDKLHIIGRLDRAIAKDYIEQSDILINIGNKTDNQCPSKVLDYISTGKPIIHFKQIDNCSSMIYLEKYPLLLTIGPNDDTNNAADKIRVFIQNNRGKMAPNALIEKLYEKNLLPNITELFKTVIEFC